MVFHMKTTLNISDSVMKKLKETAAQQEKTMSELVETALRNYLGKEKGKTKLSRLPSFDGGDFLVDISNRDYLYDEMENE
jgi:PleD family two-component response regulator